MPGLTIDAARCAHQRLADSRCRACVDACPRQAWQPVPAGLAFDAQACDSCGLCVAACPLEALALPAPLPALGHTRPPSLLLACDRAGLPAAPGGAPPAGRVPCIHAISVDLLLDWSIRYQPQTVRVATGDCAGCTRQPREPRRRLDVLWRATEGRARTRGLPAAHWQSITADTWQKLAQPPTQPDLSRRRFFGRCAAAPSSAVTANRTEPGSALYTSGRTRLVTRLQHQPETPATTRPLWTVTVDKDRCNACLACEAICPRQVFRRTVPAGDGNTPAMVWTLHAERCTGCGLCIDLCDTPALRLSDPCDSDAGGAPDRFVLGLAVCPGCGAAFHQHQSEGPATDPRCPGCQRGRSARANRVIQTETPAGVGPRP